MNRREFLAAGAAAAPLLAGLRPLDARAAAGEPLALVTADTEAHVAVVSLAARRVRRRIATIEGPRSIQSGPGGVVLVGHSAAGAVTLMEGWPVRVRRVLRGFVTPRYAVVTPDGRYGFVTDSGSGEVAVIDLRLGRVVRRAEVGARARHVTLDPAGRTLWVSLGSSAAQIAVVDVTDPLRPRVTRLVRPPFLAHDVGFSPTGRRVWVTAGREARMAIYSAQERSRPLLLGADAGPQHVTFGPALAYVASGEGRSVRVHSLADGRLLRTARVPLGSYNIQRGAGRVLTPSLGGGMLTVLDRHGRVTGEVRVASAAHDACVVEAR
jgi:DNA-binding beta-propeller fold protein YncE